MIRYRTVTAALLAILLLNSANAQQKKTLVNDIKIATPQATEEISLDLGEWHVFQFQLSKPFVVEAENVLSTEDVPAYQDQTGKAVVVFGALNSPPMVHVRVIQENRTVYRALVTINSSSGPRPPKPSPYSPRLQKAYLGDAGATAADVARLAGIYADVIGSLKDAKTGKDVWDAINQRYATMGPGLPMLRREIALILGETTAKWYTVTLTQATQKEYRKILQDILGAVQSLSGQPGPAPVPVGPHKLYIVVIEEATDRNPSRALLFDDAGVQSRLKDKGHKYLIVDKDVIEKASGGVPEKLKPYLDKARGQTLPYAIIVDQATGQQLGAEHITDSPADLLKLMDRTGG